jgi:hypothetical protein
MAQLSEKVRELGLQGETSGHYLQEYEHIVYCDICSAPVTVPAASATGSWGKVWVCDDCRQRLPVDEITVVTREVALRGVPFS